MAIIKRTPRKASSSTLSKASSSKLNEAKKPEPHPFSLRAVYLREGKQWMSDDLDPLIPGQRLVGQFRMTGNRIDVQEAVENVPDAKNIISCRITSNFEFRYLGLPIDAKDTPIEDDKYLVAALSARITVDYLIGVDEAPPMEKIKQWSESNTLLHCWPYWREFCHSTLLRMSLPITIMPMWQIN